MTSAKETKYPWSLILFIIYFVSDEANDERDAEKMGFVG